MVVVAPIITVPGVVVALALLAVAALIYALAYGADVWLRPLLVGVANFVPFVGGYIADGASAVIDFVVRQLTAAADGMASLASAWFDGLGIAFEWLSDSLSSFAADSWGALSTLFTATIPNGIAGAIDWTNQGIDAIGDKIAAGLDLLWGGIDALSGAVAYGLAQAWRGIDDLGRDIGALASLLYGQVVTGLGWVIDDAIPGLGAEIGALTDHVGDLAADVGKLAKSLDGVLPYIVGLAAAIPLVDAIAGIRAASRAERKLDRMCMLDLDDMDDLLGLVLLVPAWPLIYEAIDGAAEGLDEILGLIDPALPD